MHVCNFIDKPDFTMNSLIAKVNLILQRPEATRFRLPYLPELLIGKGFDLLAKLTGKRFAISSIRVKKFRANSVHNFTKDKTGFVSPVPLAEALECTIRYQFIESHEDEVVFYKG